MKQVRLSIAVVSTLIASGPALAQDNGLIARRLFGSIPEMTSILAGQIPPAAPIPTYEGSGASREPPSANVSGPGPNLAPKPDSLSAQAAPSQAQAANLPLSPILTQASDQVAGLVVAGSNAITAVGPAWWKVSGKDSVVWIMGTPDVIPLATAWDQRLLERRLSGAKLLIVPGNIGAVVLPKDQPVQTLPKTSLEQRLSPPLLERLTKRIGLNNAIGQAQARAQSYAPINIAGQYRIDTRSPVIAPNEFTTVTVVTERLTRPMALPGDAGNPARAVAMSLAARRQTPVLVMPFSAAAFRGYRSRLSVSQAVEEACLSHILDLLDQGQNTTTLAEAVDAWARGDVANAFKRADPMSGCDYGPTAADFWSQLVGYNLAAVQKALQTPGESVALIEFDPLLTPGGVLDQLRSQGYAIVSSAGAQ